MQKHASTEDIKTLPQAKKYQAIKNRLFLFSIFLNLCFFVLIIAMGWSKALSQWITTFSGNFFIHNAIYFVCFGFVYSVLFFPLDFYEGYLLERRFGLGRQTSVAWLKDVFKKSIITFFLSLVVLEAVYFFLWKSPVLWWLWAALFWFFVSIALTRIFPKVILPLFYKSRPLEEGVLRARIFNLLEKYGVCLKDVFILDFSKKTVKANAMVAGLGRTKQIYLSDTLVNDFSQSEIEVVLAHELGHFVHKDTFKLSILSLGLAFLSFSYANLVLKALLYKFGFSSISDIAALPLFLMVIMLVSFIVLPLQNMLGRFLEKKADLFALEATGTPEVFISMMRRLGEKNFAEFSPSKLAEIFLYNHPPINKRIAYALDFLKNRNNQNAS